MKICFLAPANSAHTIKWCNYFTSRGHEVHVISFTEGAIDGVQIHQINNQVSAGGGDLQKLLYLTSFAQVKKLVKQISPDVINVHYATSYGTVAALAGLKNYALSVWGSDIFDFPRHSPLHRWMLKFSLSRAKYLFSTSQAMADEAALYTKKHFEITPFGVDLELFTPEKRTRTQDDVFVLGTVKGLAPAYGIDTFLRTVQLVRQEHPEIPVRVRIAGKGPAQEEYHALAEELGIDDITTWLGFISQEQAAMEWANMDVAVICSNSESFGVSAVEAQASGCPVIISDIPGLMEATQPNQTSLVVPRKDERAVADAIVRLFEDRELRQRLGMQGRKYVQEHYEIISCFRHVEKLFESTLNH